MLSPGDKLNFVLFHIKMSTRSYQKETSVVVYLPQMALQNSVMKDNKFYSRETYLLRRVYYTGYENLRCQRQSVPRSIFMFLLP